METRKYSLWVRCHSGSQRMVHDLLKGSRRLAITWKIARMFEVAIAGMVWLRSVLQTIKVAR